MEHTVNIRTLLVTIAVVGCAYSGAQRHSDDAGNKAAYPRRMETAALEGAGPVVVSPDVLEGWKFLYRFVTEVEFVLCLEGRRNGETVVIEGFTLARMEAANSSSVRYQPCASDRYVGTAHNHPPVATTKSLCYQSLPDRRSFEADGRAVLDIVLCGEDRFLWVVRDGKNGTQQHGEAYASIERD
jgi:hypothetical protein